MGSIIVEGKRLSAPPGLEVGNFLDQPLCHFNNATRRSPVTEVIVHETVTRSQEATVAVLKQRNLGVHFIVRPDGYVCQHGDLALDLLWHASEHNGVSVGIEVVNPFDPKFMPSGGPWDRVIDAPWAVTSSYVVPTKEQCEATSLLVNWLTSADSGLTIPQLWPGFRGTHALAMGRLPDGKILRPGVHAHHYFGHSDGAFLVLYTWLRLEPQINADEAYEVAIALATGAKGQVDLDDYFVQNPYLQV